MKKIRKKIKKKILCLMLALMLCPMLFACSLTKDLEIPPLPEISQQTEQGQQPELDQRPEESATPTMELPTAPETQENYVLVKTETVSRTHMDPQSGTQPILIVSYESPTVYVGGRDAVTERINEHLAHLNETYVTGLDYGFGTSTGENTLLEWAIDNYTMLVDTDGGEMLAPYSSYQTVRTMRADEQVLALRYNTNEYTGGAHGNYVDRAYLFDTQTGDVLRLEQLTEDPDSLHNFLQDAMMSLYREDKDGYYAERMVEEYLATSGMTLEEAFGALIRDGSWYLDGEGLVLFSDPYELAPYAAGIIEFVIPYESLKSQINEKWLPKEQHTNGSLRPEARENIPDGSIQELDRLTLDPDGQHVCLIAEGTVRNVRVSQVAYLEHFYETAQLWTGSYMKDCLLQLDVMIPDGMPNLMISFDDEQGNRTAYLLSQSGEDGSLLLIPDDVQAVG